MMGFGMGFGLLLMILFWVGLVALAVWVVKALFTGDKGSPTLPTGQAPTAREILDQRYARGEITREQYDLMKRELAG
ncbi:MAG TPA: SHOCT domain-containing protein [Anaerolineales bacterium]|nr:SHOCT domain-containing protein [Anaerolineales bacterium]